MQLLGHVEFVQDLVRGGELSLHCFTWCLDGKFEILGIRKIHKYIQSAANKTAA